ncbi:unnamed protein product [Urochloa humidicola]
MWRRFPAMVESTTDEAASVRPALVDGRPRRCPEPLSSYWISVAEHTTQNRTREMEQIDAVTTYLAPKIPTATTENLLTVEYAQNTDFTSHIVVHTNRREPDVLLIIGLPDGPTAHFKLSILVLPEGRKGDLLVDGSFFWFSEQEVD